MSDTSIIPQGVATEAREILIVASKLKQFVKEKGELNTSAEVMDTLSDLVRSLCMEAISHAKKDGRKTLMSRDFRKI